jgi:hypothetical protein
VSDVRGAGPAVQAAMTWSSAWLWVMDDAFRADWAQRRRGGELPGLQEDPVLLNCTLPGPF